MPRHAIVIAEGGYIFPALGERYCLDNAKQNAEIIYSWMRNGLIQKVARLCQEQVILKQIRYYDCYSYDDTSPHVEKPKTNERNVTNRDYFINEFKKMPIVFFRPGKLRLNGVKPAKQITSYQKFEDGIVKFVLTEKDLKKNYQQKGVDTLIAMDAYQIITERHADLLIFITDDSDFTPLFELARSKGVTIVIHPMHFKRNPTGPLLEHSDYVVRLEPNEILLKLKSSAGGTIESGIDSALS